MRVSVNLNAQKPDTTTNAVIYARYSSHGQTEQSIEGQLAKGHEYAAAQGYTVVHEYIDRAMTGRNDNREAFQKMLSDTGKHQFRLLSSGRLTASAATVKKLRLISTPARKTG